MGFEKFACSTCVSGEHVGYVSISIFYGLCSGIVNTLNFHFYFPFASFIRCFSGYVRF